MPAKANEKTKKCYATNLGLLIHTMEDYLSKNRFPFNTVGPSFSIKIENEEDIFNIQSKLESYIEDIFGCCGKRDKHLYKSNFHDKTLFIQFKREMH